MCIRRGFFIKDLLIVEISKRKCYKRNYEIRNSSLLTYIYLFIYFLFIKKTHVDKNGEWLKRF